MTTPEAAAMGESALSSAPVGRVHIVSLDVREREEVNITPLTDLHLDSRDCDYDALRALLQERAKLPNHRVLLLGDVMDVIVPPDVRRWRPSAQHQSLAGQDAWVNASVAFAVERLKIEAITYDLVCPGNHEDEFLKRNGVDVTSMLAYALGCQRGGYSGFLQYRLCDRRKDGRPSSYMLRIAYHHGAWGGRVIKGYGGARDWFRSWDDWHVALWGHNHQSHAHREWRLRASGDRLKRYPVYYVNCGSWVNTLTEDAKRTHYGERHGYAPAPPGAPLITAWLGRDDRRNLEVQYRVVV